MAAPTATARQTPDGIFLENGYSTKITFAADPNIAIWEKTVKPSGQDGGPAIDLATMHSVRYVEKAAGALIESTPITGKAAYDPAVKDAIDLLINVHTTITTRYPDGTTEAEYGYLQKAEYDELQRNVFPELSYTIQPTNRDPLLRVEAGRAIVSAPGT